MCHGSILFIADLTYGLVSFAFTFSHKKVNAEEIRGSCTEVVLNLKKKSQKKTSTGVYFLTKSIAV